MRMDEMDAKVEMALYTDANFTSAYSHAPTIHLRNKVRTGGEPRACSSPNGLWRLESC